MARFHFALQGLLEMRERTERERTVELERAAGANALAAAQLAELQAQFAAHGANVAARYAALDTPALQRAVSELELIARTCDVQAETARWTQGVFDAAREQHRAAVRSRLQLETLRRRKLRDFEERLSAAEIRELDEANALAANTSFP